MKSRGGVVAVIVLGALCAGLVFIVVQGGAPPLDDDDDVIGTSEPLPFIEPPTENAETSVAAPDEDATAQQGRKATIVVEGVERTETNGIETYELDLGTVPNDLPTKHNFDVRNEGTATLFINTLKTTCGCTKALMEKKEIAPGGSEPLTILFSPSKVHAFESHKTVTVGCNDPDTPLMKIRVSAIIEPEFSVVPDALDFGTIQKGQTVERTVHFKQLTDVPVELLRVQLAQQKPGVEFSFEKLPDEDWEVPGRAEYDVTVRITPEIQAGAFRSTFLLNTSCARVSNFRCRISADVEAFYHLSSPSILVRGARPSGTPDVGSVSILSDQPYELVSAEITGEHLDLKTTPGSRPNETVLTVSIKPSATQGRLSEKINLVLKSGDLELKDVVPVYVMVSHITAAQIEGIKKDQEIMKKMWDGSGEGISPLDLVEKMTPPKPAPQP